MIDEAELREKIKEKFPELFKLMCLKHKGKIHLLDFVRMINGSIKCVDIVTEVNKIYNESDFEYKDNYSIATQYYNELFYQYLINNRHKINLWCREIELDML